jgi:hypothetical protein
MVIQNAQTLLSAGDVAAIVGKLSEAVQVLTIVEMTMTADMKAGLSPTFKIVRDACTESLAVIAHAQTPDYTAGLERPATSVADAIGCMEDTID